MTMDIGEFIATLSAISAGHPMVVDLPVDLSNIDHQIGVRLLYGEVLFNCLGLRAGANASPPRPMLDDRVYRGLLASGGLNRLRISVDQVGIVAGAYAVASITDVVFGQDWVALTSMRLRGSEFASLEAVAREFRKAEELLRPIAWNAEEQQRVMLEIQRQHGLEAIAAPWMGKRALNALNGLPGWLWSLLLWKLSSRLWKRYVLDRPS